MLDLLTKALHHLETGTPVVLATLVRSRGSTPQKQGAAMLVLPTGQTFGTLGGGCVEAETRQRALTLLANPTPTPPQLLNFKLDHDYGWDDGLVCGGLMDIALELFTPCPPALPTHTTLPAINHAQPNHETPGGTGVPPVSSLPTKEKLQPLIAALQSRHPTTYRLTINNETYTIPLTPPPQLIIAGAGHVAHALASLAHNCNFQTTVIDDRPDMASPDRFPNATRLIGPIDLELSRLSPDAQTYIVIVTRGHKNDAQALAAVIQSNARYIGLIGSKRKIRTILESLHTQGTPEEKLLSLHAPIGLDIGAISPHEIAISILAELIATRQNISPPNSLKFPPKELQTWLHKDQLKKS